LVAVKKQQYSLPGQIIAYCRMITQATALAQALVFSVFHRWAGDAAEKSRLLHRFTSGGGNVMTATNAFVLGIDAPSIRTVQDGGQCLLRLLSDTSINGRSLF